MKKIKYFLKISSLISMVTLLTACSSDGSSSKSSGTLSTINSVSSIIENQIGSQTNDSYQSIFNQQVDVIDENQKDYSRLEDVSADIDFTKLSQVVSFSQMNNMFYMYPDYLGQSVKIKGTYYADFIQELNMTYHYILLVDDTNCCQGIMEFRLPTGATYPVQGEELMIVGYYTLDIDETGEYPYVNVYDYII